MRHKLKKLEIGKDSKHRKALMRGLATDFLSREYLQTTVTKAKLLRSFVEKLITRARVDNLHNRRIIFRTLKNTKILKKLFDDVAKRYVGRPGGYTKIRRLGFRKGDGSEMSLIQLVSAGSVAVSKDENVVEKPKK